MVYTLRNIGAITGGAFTATSGTIACSNARQVNLQVTMDSNSGYVVSLKPVTAVAGTCSINSYGGIVSDLGTYECPRPAGVGSGNWWLAYRVYNGATGAKGGASDKYSGEKLG